MFVLQVGLHWSLARLEHRSGVWTLTWWSWVGAPHHHPNHAGCSTQQGQSFGKDISSWGGVVVGGQEECAVLCAALQECLVWVVRRLDSSWTCWLKTAGFPPSAPDDASFITGTQSCGAHGATGASSPP